MQTAYFVNAFTSDKVLSGNPAAVCLLEAWPADHVMQNVAAQHNLSETAFIVEMAPTCYAIRWFTPQCEVDLCGHATLAAAHILFEHFLPFSQRIVFESASGELAVTKQQSSLTLDFPKRELPVLPHNPVSGKLDVEVEACFGDGDTLVLVFEYEEQVRSFNPDYSLLGTLEERLIYITAKARHCDFVWRVFAPKLGVLEDPVTGSAYTSLAPLWAQKLDKQKLTAQQLSAKGGRVIVECCGSRVAISGEARTIMIAQWMVEAEGGY